MSDSPGLIDALEPIARIFQALDIRFFVGGSIASSFHGASRSTMDVDLVADLKADHIEPFARRLSDEEFYVSQVAIEDAVSSSSCFNAIHLASSFKVDIFILRDREFDRSSMRRAKPGKVDVASEFEAPIASPEDTILSKLEWYRRGNEVSDRQWDDVTRVMKILGSAADHDYLNRNANNLNVADLLQKLMKQLST